MQFFLFLINVNDSVKAIKIILLLRRNAYSCSTKNFYKKSKLMFEQK